MDELLCRECRTKYKNQSILEDQLKKKINMHYVQQTKTIFNKFEDRHVKIQLPVWIGADFEFMIVPIAVAIPDNSFVYKQTKCSSFHLC